MAKTYEVVIIGSGPAGLTAAIYTARARLTTLVLEKETVGGYPMNIELIENYPGFSQGVAGSQLATEMLIQARNFGAEFKLAEVSGLKPGETSKIVSTSEGDIECQAVIVASGARPRKLGVPGEEEFAGRGVAYCGFCEGSPFAKKVVVVAGGGDSGITEALYLSRIASRVIVLEMLPQLLAAKILQEKARATMNIRMRCGVKIQAICGDDHVTGLKYLDIESGEEETLTVDGVFVRVGTEANTAFLKGVVPLDGGGQVIVNPRMETSVPGIFAAGDVRSNSPRQIAAAVGDGVVAAICAERYLKTSGVC